MPGRFDYTYVLHHYSVLDPSVQTASFPHTLEEAFKKLPPESLHALFIDGSQLRELGGWVRYFAREPHCLTGLCNAFIKGLELFEKNKALEVNPSDFKEIHKSLAKNVDNTMFTEDMSQYMISNPMPGEFRRDNDRAASYLKISSTSKAGVTELIEYFQNTHKDSFLFIDFKMKVSSFREACKGLEKNDLEKFIEFYEKYSIASNMGVNKVYELIFSGYSNEEKNELQNIIKIIVENNHELLTKVFYFTDKANESEEILEKACKNFDQLMSDQSLTEEQKLLEVLMFCQSLARTHIFPDMNIRTTLIFLQSFLYHNGYLPIMLNDPNTIEGYSLDELFLEVKKGMMMTRKNIEFGVFSNMNSQTLTYLMNEANEMNQKTLGEPLFSSKTDPYTLLNEEIESFKQLSSSILIDHKNKQAINQFSIEATSYLTLNEVKNSGDHKMKNVVSYYLYYTLNEYKKNNRKNKFVTVTIDPYNWSVNISDSKEEDENKYRMEINLLPNYLKELISVKADELSEEDVYTLRLSEDNKDIEMASFIINKTDEPDSHYKLFKIASEISGKTKLEQQMFLDSIIEKVNLNVCYFGFNLLVSQLEPEIKSDYTKKLLNEIRNLSQNGWIVLFNVFENDEKMQDELVISYINKISRGMTKKEETQIELNHDVTQLIVQSISQSYTISNRHGFSDINLLIKDVMIHCDNNKANQELFTNFLNFLKKSGIALTKKECVDLLNFSINLKSESIAKDFIINQSIDDTLLKNKFHEMIHTDSKEITKFVSILKALETDSKKNSLTEPQPPRQTKGH